MLKWWQRKDARVAVGFCATISLIGIQPVPALAQNCPEVQALRQQLTELRSKKQQSVEQLQTLEAKGPETLADQDRLAKLRDVRPTEIAAERRAFQAKEAMRKQQLLTERNQRIADLSRQRDQTKARNDAELAAQQAKYNDLFVKGPQAEDLDRQAQAASAREADLVKEKQRVLADLRNGKFCSQCGRSAYEIEKSGTETFEQHLVSVKGYAIMKPEQIQARSDSYDQQIAQAHQQAQQLAASANKVRADHAKALSDALAAITRLKVDGPDKVTSMQAQIDSTVANSDRALAATESELQSGLKTFDQMEAQRAGDVRALDGQIAERVVAYDKQVADLRADVSATDPQEDGLKAAFLTAAIQCKASVIEAQQAAASDDNNSRQAYDAAKQQFADASYQDIMQREAARRQAIDSGQAPSIWTPSSMLGKLEGAVQSAGNMVQSARKSWKEGMGLRESSFYTGLDENVRKKIDQNLETFTSGTNTARAVIRDSLGRLRSGAASALMQNAFGGGNGLSPDLAAAVENAKPSVSGTIKRQLMPTIEAIAIEKTIDARERLAGRSFDPQERVEERGFVRVAAFLTNPKKLGDAMIETYDEAMTTFRRNLFDDEDNQ